MIRGWITLVSSLIIVFLVLPFIIIDGIYRNQDLEERGKRTTATVVDVYGFKHDKVRFKYKVKGVDFENVRESPHTHRYIRIGDNITILYDSLRAKNVKVLWKE